MFAVIQIGNSQFKVSEGDTILADVMNEKEGKAFKLGQVVMYAKGNEVRVGQPFLKDVQVEAKVGVSKLGPKTEAFKFRRRKSSRTKKGHRQQRTEVLITKISA